MLLEDRRETATILWHKHILSSYSINSSAAMKRFYRYTESPKCDNFKLTKRKFTLDWQSLIGFERKLGLSLNEESPNSSQRYNYSHRTPTSLWSFHPDCLLCGSQVSCDCPHNCGTNSLLKKKKIHLYVKLEHFVYI